MDSQASWMFHSSQQMTYWSYWRQALLFSTFFYTEFMQLCIFISVSQCAITLTVHCVPPTEHSAGWPNVCKKKKPQKIPHTITALAPSLSCPHQACHWCQILTLKSVDRFLNQSIFFQSITVWFGWAWVCYILLIHWLSCCWRSPASWFNVLGILGSCSPPL